tara:strand:+ start:121 stop:603 length:483 start_codon:yes stop_codon:yes gene_type:complete
MYFLFPTISFASSIVIDTLDDGTVLAKFQTTYEPKRIIALLNDPQKMSKIDGELEVSILQIFDNCKDVQYTIPNFFMNITYTARACLDQNRIELTLLESDDLSEFASYWDIQPIETGSEITYSIRSIPKFPLPLFIIRQQTQVGVEAFFERFLSYIDTHK